MTQEGFFKLKYKTDLNELSIDSVVHESDLLIQDGPIAYQFKYMEPVNSDKVVLEPGIFSLKVIDYSIKAVPLEMKVQKLLSSVSNTQIIKHEADIFFNNLHIYDELEIDQKARKILLYSDPGMGKSSTITEYCREALATDPGTIVMIWPTESVKAKSLLPFLADTVIYNEKATRLILVAEDIGGDEREGSGNARAVDSSMLEMLDGISNTFKIPTLIIATTNYPQNLLSALADRPGRFDNIIKLNPPSAVERVEIMEFFAKRPLTDEEKEVISDKKVNKFSIAHLKETVIRSRLHQKSIAQCIQELLNHKQLFQNNFSDKRDMGF